MLTLKQKTMLGDVPSDWGFEPLGRLLAGHFPGDWGDERGSNMVRVLRSTNLTDDGRLDLHDVALRALSPNKCVVLAPRKNDILLERSGGGPDQPVGRIGFIEDDMPGHAFSNFLQLLRPDPAKIHPRLLGWMLYWINRTGRVLRLEQQTTQMRNLNFRDYLTTPLPLPPPDEQVPIVRTLDSVDKLIECTKIAHRRAVKLRDALINASISRGTRGETQKKSDAGLIPSSWSCEDLGEHIVDGPTNGIYRPESDYGNFGAPILRIDSFDDGYIHAVSELRRVNVNEAILRRYELKERDVVINRVNSLSHIGKSTIVPKLAEPTLFESNMMKLRCSARLRSDFLIVVLCSDVARKHWLSRAKPAVNQASINQRDVRELPVPIPSGEEQELIAHVVAGVRAQIEELDALLAEQQLLGRSLMNDLLNGRVRVNSTYPESVGTA